MGEVVRFRPPALKERGRDTRGTEASLLRKAIEEGWTTFASGEAERVAAQLDGFIERHAATLGYGGMTDVCGRIWSGDGNPARRRPELRRAKRPTTLLEYVEKIAQATDAREDDVLLEAFRNTRFEEAVAACLRGVSAGPKPEAFWSTLSDTLHGLVGAVVRAEQLEAHRKLIVELNASYNLVTETFCSSPGRLCGPLANWNEHVEAFPPIPSVVLFSEPKSVAVERQLTVRGTGRAIPVRMTVLREVRLAIGPADNTLSLAPLFEFRSVLQLVGPEGPLRIRCPWLYLDEDEVEVEVDGAWRTADIPFDGGDPDSMPEGFVAEPHVAEVVGARLASWRFPAALEAPLQFEHNYVVWRPVTAGTCRELLHRPHWGVTLGHFFPEPPAGRPDTFCPPGTLAEAIEVALHVDGPEGLAGLLRAEAARMAALVRGWHAERAGMAEAVHRDLRAKWEEWS